MTTHALSILIVHGIGWGDNREKYARPLERNIAAAFEKAVRGLRLRDVDRRDYKPQHALRFKAVFWSPVTQEPQDALIKLMKLSGWPLLRRLNPYYIARKQMVALLGDVIAYESGGTNNVYRAVHALLEEGTRELAADARASLPASGFAPLTVIGHSLGSVIASDFVWDSTRGADEPYHFRDHPFTVKNMVLLGSPMAIYALRNNPGADRQDIIEALDSPVAVDPEGGTWLNMYDPQDPIALPLKPIRAYAEAGVLDCPVRAGNWLASLTPLSHVGYWDCDDVAQAVGRKLALDWAALNAPGFDAARYQKALKAFRKDLQR